MKFTINCQRSSVPIELLTLVSMLIDGMDFSEELFSQSALTCTQQIMFNFKSRKNTKKQLTSRRHQKGRETPS